MRKTPGSLLGIEVAIASESMQKSGTREMFTFLWRELAIGRSGKLSQEYLRIYEMVKDANW